SSCYVYACNPLPNYGFACNSGLPTTGCTGIRIAASPTDRLTLRWLGNQLDAFEELPAQATALGLADSNEAFLPLTTGSTPFRAFWRANDGLLMQTLPPTLTIPNPGGV